MHLHPVLHKFHQTINDDLTMFRPQTTPEERNHVVSRGLYLLNKPRPTISYMYNSPIKALTTITVPHGPSLFMCRPLNSKLPLPITPPKDKYKIFKETSTDIYENYLRTIDYLEGHSFLPEDLNKCKSAITNDILNVLCWSNSSILLNKVLSDCAEMMEKNKSHLHITTFGSPLLISTDNNTTAINVYHEDDWILGFMLYLNSLESPEYQVRNTIHTVMIDDKCRKYVILSRDWFAESTQNQEPHRCYDILF